MELANWQRTCSVSVQKKKTKVRAVTPGVFHYYSLKEIQKMHGEKFAMNLQFIAYQLALSYDLSTRVKIDIMTTTDRL